MGGHSFIYFFLRNISLKKGDPVYRVEDGLEQRETMQESAVEAQVRGLVACTGAESGNGSV